MRKYFSIFIFLGAVLLVGLLTEGEFFSARNLTNLTRQVCINGILSLGMTYVIITAGIDLSVGSVVALSGIVAALLQTQGGELFQGYFGALLSFSSAVGVGFLCGLFNGAFIVQTKVVPFIITLGLMVIARGLALIFSNGAAVAPLAEEFNFFGQGYFDKTFSIALVCVATFLGIFFNFRTHRNIFVLVAILIVGGVFVYAFGGYRGAPVPVLIFGVLALLSHFFLKNTVWGRYVVATGSNAEAAFLSGVPVAGITLAVYTWMGALSGLSGAILSARLNGALPTAGDLFELDAIAAVVIGGTRLSGGVGSIGGSVLGAFLIGVLNNGMSLLNITEFYQKVIKGVIIILAVWLDTKGRKK